MTNSSSPVLDSSSYTPLYKQLAEILRKSIHEGQYKPGDKLPSENDLAQRYNISRITATAALEELVNARLAYRMRGLGTFVAQPFLNDFSFFSSFSEDMLSRGLNPSSVLISLGSEKPDDITCEKLKVPRDKEYCCLVRVRKANNQPVAFQRAYLVCDKYPELEKADLEALSLFDVMRSVYGYLPTWGEAIVEAGTASPEEAGYLDLDPQTPVLIVWHLTLDDHFDPLEYVRSVYRSDRFSFSTGRHPLRDFPLM